MEASRLIGNRLVCMRDFPCLPVYPPKEDRQACIYFINMSYKAAHLRSILSGNGYEQKSEVFRQSDGGRYDVVSVASHCFCHER